MKLQIKIFLSVFLTAGTYWFWLSEPLTVWKFKILFALILLLCLYLIWQKKELQTPVVMAEFIIFFTAYSYLSAERFGFLSILVYVILFTLLFSTLFLDPFLEKYPELKSKGYKPILAALISIEAFWALAFWQTHPLVKAAMAFLAFYTIVLSSDEKLNRQHANLFVVLLSFSLLIVATLKWGIM